jgi:hypothetical protein
MTIVLGDGALALTIAPERGAEARSLVAAGVELLYHPPWTPEPLPPGPLEAVAWERSWHGGWALLWPNAGAACTVDGVEHGFHGAGSVAPFELTERDERRALLCCELGGLRCERGWDVCDGRVRATVRIANRSERALPLIVVEHLILGGGLAAEATAVELDGGRIVGQEWDGRPLPGGSEWPWFEGEDYSQLPPAASRFAVVRDLPAGSARVSSPAGAVLDIRFDRAAYPHLWLWEERFGASAEPWEGRGECLAVEPSTVPSTDGLAGAIARGEAILLPPGGEHSAWIELTPSQGGRGA